MTDHYDVIVIGSGAGGGTLTHALAPTGKRILLLERGDFLPREPQNWDSKSVWIDLRYHNSGKWTDADTGKEFPPKQNYYVGGNTKVYGAILFRFRERDFEEIQHVDGISPAWPLSYADFEPWYTRAEHLYHVHGQRGADPDEPPSAAPYRYPPLSHEPRIAQLEADLAGAGLRPFPLPVGLIYDESAPQFSPCIRCATCDGYPCLVNGKADAHIVCVEPALRYPNVTLRTRTRVMRLETDEAGRAVTRVVADHDGQTQTYSADLVVVSAGAINSAALLLASASERHPDGLGNGSGAVGRHLMMHNNSSLIAFSKIPNPTKFQKTLGVNDFYFGDPADDGTWPYPLGAMQMLGKSDAVLIGFDAPEAGDPAELARHAMDFWLTTEDLPLAWQHGEPGPRRPDPAAVHPDQHRSSPPAQRAVQGPAQRHAMPGGRAARLLLPRRSARYLRGGAPERDGAVRHRPRGIRPRPELQAARAGQRLRRRLQLLRVQHGGEPDADDHRQRPSRRRPHRRAARRRRRA